MICTLRCTTSCRLVEKYPNDGTVPISRRRNNGKPNHRLEIRSFCFSGSYRFFYGRLRLLPRRRTTPCCGRFFFSFLFYCVYTKVLFDFFFSYQNKNHSLRRWLYCTDSIPSGISIAKSLNVKHSSNLHNDWIELNSGRGTVSVQFNFLNSSTLSIYLWKLNLIYKKV